MELGEAGYVIESHALKRACPETPDRMNGSLLMPGGHASEGAVAPMEEEKSINAGECQHTPNGPYGALKATQQHIHEFELFSDVTKCEKYGKRITDGQIARRIIQ